MAVFFSKSAGEPSQKSKIESAFPFLKEPGHVISLVGAGGKTSLLYEMARFCASQGLKTLVSTTTHIFKPDPLVYACDWEQVEQLWNNGSYAVVGKCTSNEKLSILPYEELYRYIEQADMVLLEADGAKRMPAKVPADGEPIILPECDIVIGIMGLDALNQPLEQVCFRREQAMKLLQTEANDCVTVGHMVQILSSGQGTRKLAEGRTYMVVLNKCDQEERKRQGDIILELLSNAGIRGIMSCFKEGAE